MSPEELMTRLQLHGIEPNDVFNIDGDLLEDDKYHLACGGGLWAVYYSERGHKWDYREFSSERDACDYLWSLLEADETIWR